LSERTLRRSERGEGRGEEGKGGGGERGEGREERGGWRGGWRPVCAQPEPFLGGFVNDRAAQEERGRHRLARGEEGAIKGVVVGQTEVASWAGVFGEGLGEGGGGDEETALGEGSAREEEEEWKRRKTLVRESERRFFSERSGPEEKNCREGEVTGRVDRRGSRSWS
jgi:hypothetical protein